MQIKPREPKPVTQIAATSAKDGKGVREDAVSGIRDPEFNRNMQRIKNIMSMEITADEKVRQLSRIEMESQRNIVFEEERIKEIKAKIGG